MIVGKKELLLTSMALILSSSIGFYAVAYFDGKIEEYAKMLQDLGYDWEDHRFLLDQTQRLEIYATLLEADLTLLMQNNADEADVTHIINIWEELQVSSVKASYEAAYGRLPEKAKDIREHLRSKNDPKYFESILQENIHIIEKRNAAYTKSADALNLKKSIAGKWRNRIFLLSIFLNTFGLFLGILSTAFPKE